MDTDAKTLGLTEHDIDVFVDKPIEAVKLPSYEVYVNLELHGTTLTLSATKNRIVSVCVFKLLMIYSWWIYQEKNRA